MGRLKFPQGIGRAGIIALSVLAVLIALATTWSLTRSGGKQQTAPLALPAREKLGDELVKELLTKAAQQNGSRVSAKAPSVWVRVRNSHSLENRNRNVLPGDICFLEENQDVVLVKIEALHLVLRYEPAGTPNGTTCPDGTLFHLRI
jgi:hypothetical protein